MVNRQSHFLICQTTALVTVSWILSCLSDSSILLMLRWSFFYATLFRFLTSPVGLTSCPAGTQSYVWSCRWWHLPTAPPQYWRRRPCGKWTPRSYAARTSARREGKKQRHSVRLLNPHTDRQTYSGSLIWTFWYNIAAEMMPENAQTAPGEPYPLLPVAVLQVVGGAIVPVEPDADEHGRQEAIFSHDDKIGEEPAKSLDHTCTRRQRWGLREILYTDKKHHYDVGNERQEGSGDVLNDWSLMGIWSCVKRHSDKLRPAGSIF